MKYVKNEKGELCKVEDISAGIIRSYYNCIICNQKVIFVNENIKYCSHFRHYKNNKNVECEFYNFNNQNNNILENIIKNKVSNFHIKWQKIFPKNNTEIKLHNELTETYKRADIYMENIRNNIKDEQQDPFFR